MDKVAVAASVVVEAAVVVAVEVTSEEWEAMTGAED